MLISHNLCRALGCQDIDPGDHPARRRLNRDSAIPSPQHLFTGDERNAVPPLSAVARQPRAPATMMTVMTSMVGGGRAISLQRFATATTTTTTEAALLVISILPVYRLAQHRSCRACPTPDLANAVGRVSGSESRICHQGQMEKRENISSGFEKTTCLLWERNKVLVQCLMHYYHRHHRGIGDLLLLHRRSSQ